MLQADHAVSNERNHPLSLRMAVIAFISFNITIACIYGSFSVLLGAVQTRLGISAELSTLGIPAVSLSTAVCAPFVGALATRFSLRLIMLIGSILNVAGFVLLAAATNFPLYIAAFFLLLGPGMAVGVVLPSTLVTRWFAANRGKALGFVNTPLVIAVVPLLSTWVLLNHGLAMAELTLAAMSVVTVVANLFIVDRPPGADAAAEAHGAAVPAGAGGVTMPQLLGSTRFWGLTIAFISSAVSSIIITVHMVPMAHTWGLSATLAASLLSIQSLIGIAGTNLFGWLADRLGSLLTLALVVFDGAILWMLMLIHPSFPEAAVIIGLIGLHAAGMVPVFSAALSDVFGQESFSRAYGLVQLIILPFSVLCVPAASMVFTRTNSYAGVIIGVAVFLGIGCLTALSARRRPQNPALAE